MHTGVVRENSTYTCSRTNLKSCNRSFNILQMPSRFKCRGKVQIVIWLARTVLARSELCQEFLARSAQETANSTARQQNGGMLPIPCLPAISIVGDGSAPDVQQLADYMPEHHDAPEDAAVREADAWSPIASDATVLISELHLRVRNSAYLRVWSYKESEQGSLCP
jgi:hypothetical protein